MNNTFSNPSNSNKKEYTHFNNYPTPTLTNLWLKYSKEATKFSIWSPKANEVKLHFFKNGNDGKPFKSHSLKLGAYGIWTIEIAGDLHGTYYTYRVRINKRWLNEIPGIYAQAVGVNGQRAMVLDFESTNPKGWNIDQGPQLKYTNEAIIYELQIRDITIHKSSGSSRPGKYLGLIEENTTNIKGVKTGIDHLKELGITHVHLLPTFDHCAIDETKLDSAPYNWGYAPQNYNVPEGSFASNPFDAAIRIKEFKKMVQAFHNNNIGVIIDVVYNHTGSTEASNFNQEVPRYYYRFLKDGNYSNASACGNETASERAMMRKFMIESVVYWAKEYHLDGFRFDLMGIHDIATMNAISTALKSVNKNIIIYGEGWAAGDSPLSEEKRALKKHIKQMPLIAAFNDELRDGIKGSVFDENDTGFVSGKLGMEETIKFGIVGAITHPQINYTALNYSNAAWANEPWQVISYVSCHDNHTLYDKLKISNPKASEKEIIAMNQLANAIVMTSQGTAFIHAGAELLRSKNGAYNSYNLPDTINQIDWNWKVKNAAVFEYYKNLIAFRKNHPAFRMTSGEQVRAHLKFIKAKNGLIIYKIKNHANGDMYKNILVIYNARKKTVNCKLNTPWQLAVFGKYFYHKKHKTCESQIIVPAISMAILFQK